jgi:hypothetical protein
MLNNNVRITRLKNRPKGILIPVDEYSPKPIYEDKYVKVMGASVSTDVDGRPEVGLYQKVLKEYCSICGGSVDFKAIWVPTNQYPRRRLQWFCKQHAQQYGPAQQLGFKLKVVK